MLSGIIASAVHEPVFGMYPVIVNQTKNHVSLLVKCQNDILSPGLLQG